jgi:hypothetical protein
MPSLTRLCVIQFIALHLLVLLSFFSLWGWIETDNKYFIVCSAMSFYGALCFAFIGAYKRNKDQRPR